MGLTHFGATTSQSLCMSVCTSKCAVIVYNQTSIISASSQHCRIVDADAWCIRALNVMEMVCYGSSTELVENLKQSISRARNYSTFRTPYYVNLMKLQNAEGGDFKGNCVSGKFFHLYRVYTCNLFATCSTWIW